MSKQIKLHVEETVDLADVEVVVIHRQSRVVHLMGQSDLIHDIYYNTDHNFFPSADYELLYVKELELSSFVVTRKCEVK